MRFYGPGRLEVFYRRNTVSEKIIFCLYVVIYWGYFGKYSTKPYLPLQIVKNKKLYKYVGVITVYGFNKEKKHKRKNILLSRA